MENLHINSIEMSKILIYNILNYVVHIRSGFIKKIPYLYTRLLQFVTINMKINVDLYSKIAVY